ncbi:hypothetical protein QAD02_012678 [Eretmocerus hayati]|uniref:Uncharacterized protein n=1 Tax=Eretmocerus hayati TaxID=131215 RepID=A0ACC2P1E7_9HYME|nr:hypothetical protein QAD02_012678 [Eretmocerus hayati]
MIKNPILVLDSSSEGIELEVPVGTDSREDLQNLIKVGSGSDEDVDWNEYCRKELQFFEGRRNAIKFEPKVEKAEIVTLSSEDEKEFTTLTEPARKKPKVVQVPLETRDARCSHWYDRGTNLTNTGKISSSKSSSSSTSRLTYSKTPVHKDRTVIRDRPALDSVYAERYMGSPNITSNYHGYMDADLRNRVKHLRGKMFYLIHGMADNNVPYQQSMIMARRLVDENISFRQQVGS